MDALFLNNAKSENVISKIQFVSEKKKKKKRKEHVAMRTDNDKTTTYSTYSTTDSNFTEGK